MSDFDFSLFKYSYRIDKIGILKKHNGLENVISEFRYFINVVYEISENAQYDCDIFKVSILDVDNIENFIPYEEISNDTFINWIDNKLKSNNSFLLNEIFNQAKEEMFPNKYYVDYKE
jgi:hypothetical protein